MGGAAWALFAGVSFGIFQAVNRRANQLIDPYRTTFALLLVAVVGLGIFSAATQDLALLSSAPVFAFLAFGAAGVIHFFFGWTFLSLSQQRIGASNTGVVTAATPLIGSLLAALVLDEKLGPVALVAIALVSAGVILIARRASGGGDQRLTYPWFALAASLSWGTSPLFIRWGLEGLSSPVIGVTIGLAAATALYAAVLASGRVPTTPGVPPEVRRWILIGGILVAVAIAAQWTALDLVEVNVVVTLQQAATPVVVLIAPFIVGSVIERWTWRLILGMVAVIAGSTMVIWAN
jgi:drug/metabolite transporter (DMT)-like permease